MAIYIVAAAAIVICALTVIFCRGYVLRAFNSIDAVLDRILSKDSGMLSETIGEDRLSKLTFKARRILDLLHPAVIRSERPCDYYIP